MFDEARKWAEGEFGSASLGDRRRVDRLVKMAAQAARHPDGKISSVFESDAERQGAYDFLEGKVDAASLVDSMAQATFERANDDRFVYVAVDGSSVSVVDRAMDKDLGSLGSRNQNGRGMKVMGALAISSRGVTLGLTALEWWARSTKRMKRSGNRPHRARETKYWIDAIEHTAERRNRAGSSATLWFQLDREGDGGVTLRSLASSGHEYTVRSSHDRRLRDEGSRRRYIRQILRKTPALGALCFDARESDGRVRSVIAEISFAHVTLRLHDHWTKVVRYLDVTAVRVKEIGRAPNRVEWTLLTNHAVIDFASACDVVFGYRQRWRIEEFHRAWKSGACRVETTQLRSARGVSIWATLLAAVATRVERLKGLARQQPDEPATIELAEHEVRALILMKRRRKKQTETITDDIPSIATAVTWIAELGGYTGKSSGGPPGSVTIARGLERLTPAAEMFLLVSKPSR